MASSMCAAIKAAFAEQRELDAAARAHAEGCHTCRWKLAQAVVVSRFSPWLRAVDGTWCCGVLPRKDGDGRCTLAETFFPLAAADQLPFFFAAFKSYSYDGDDGFGNCHDVALGLLADLTLLNRSHGWSWARGTVTFAVGPTDHSWCEYDGWAIDAASGKIMIVDAASYRSMLQATRVRARDWLQAQYWLSMRARGSR